MKLPPKYLQIYKLAKPFMLKGRELDEEHHLFVAEMMFNILKEVPLDEEVMIASALLHDIGYAKIPPKERRNHWTKKVKKEHMLHGSVLAREILKKVNFPPEKIKKIYAIIATHDNPELGLPIKYKEGRYLKEADILWMTTEKAFWLDVKRRPKITPAKWLLTLENRFTKDPSYTDYLTTNFSHQKTKNFIKRMKRKLKNGIVKGELC